MAPANPSFTFGVEIECMVEVNLPKGKWPSTTTPAMDTDAEVYSMIRNRMQQDGIQVNPEHEPSISDSNLFGSWTIERDPTISTPSPVFPTWRCGVELISPILPLNGLSFRQISRAIGSVRKMATLTHTDTCGLHVHVGFQNSSLLPFASARRLAQIVVAHEDHIEQMLDADEISAETFAVWAQPPSRLSSLFELSMQGKMQLVQNTTNMTELVDLMSPYEDHAAEGARRGIAYNILGLAGVSVQGKTCKPTVEFRRHQGTVDVRDISMWVEFCVQLVRWCHLSSQAETTALVGTELPGGVRLRLEGFLRTVKVREEVVQYYVESAISS